jgi:hypothetical protein
MRLPGGAAALLLFVAGAVPIGSASAHDKIDPAVAAQVETTGHAEVVVFFDPPAPERPGDLATRRRRIAARRDRIVGNLPREHVQVGRTLSLVSGFSASVTATGLSGLESNETVLRVEPAHYGSGGLAESVPQIRADAVHNRSDLGQGITVAVLDTGIDSDHPDLAGSIVAEECFCSANCCPNGSRRQSGRGSAFTRFVHGIHVTGTIVSKGLVAPVGVAPGAQVVAVKVLNDENRGNLLDWVAALEWIAQNRPDVQAINMSLVSDTVYTGACDGADAFTRMFAQIIGVLRSRGVLTFAASGNGGESKALAAPACVDAAVAVGAVTKRDRIASFTDSGPALDLLAPGVGIVSAGPNGATAVLSGTSMAVPHTTGTAALLLAANPSIAADATEAALRSTNVWLTEARNGLRFPRINALSSLNAVWNQTSPILGGGSQRTDCLVTWDVLPPAIATALPVGGAACSDNDPACDADQTVGQCTFRLSLCFNSTDRRLPYCDTGQPVTSGQLIWPRADSARTAFDAANAAAFAAALPAFPVTGTNQCTGPIWFVVPTGSNSGKQWIRFTARSSGEVARLVAAAVADDGVTIDAIMEAAARGRSDADRLRFTCLPAGTR